MKATQLVARCITCLLLIVPGVASAQPFVISSDGLEVTDLKTGLIWRRCAEGFLFNGTTKICDVIGTATATRYTHEAALLRAASVSGIIGVDWRLPNIKELASIVDRNQINPAVDRNIFPGTKTDFPFWSSSPHAGYPTGGWSVDFYVGVLTYGNNRSSTYYVRLVRAGQ